MLKLVLIALFLLAMVMATGPGVLLVNTPTTILGIPAVYAWGILWYFVIVGVALTAFFTLWKKSAAEISDSVSDPDPGERA